MAHQTHKLRVLTRDLAVTVPADAVPALERAEADLGHRLAQLQRQYSVHDETYLLAMCCLQYALELTAEHEAQADRMRQQQQALATHLDSLDAEVQQALRNLGVGSL